MKLEEYEMDMTLPISKITVKAIPTENIKEKIKELIDKIKDMHSTTGVYLEIESIFGAELCSGVEE